MFNKSLQRNVSRQKKTMQVVYETYANITNAILRNREKTMKFLCVQGVNESLMGELEERYEIYEHVSFKGKEVLSAIEMLNTENENNAYHESNILEKMKRDERDILTRFEQEMQLILKPYDVCSLDILNSHLLTNKGDVKFVLENLDFPKDMKLLYRAS
jgi:hypothetical protein